VFARGSHALDPDHRRPGSGEEYCSDCQSDEAMCSGYCDDVDHLGSFRLLVDGGPLEADLRRDGSAVKGLPVGTAQPVRPTPRRLEAERRAGCGALDGDAGPAQAPPAVPRPSASGVVTHAKLGQTHRRGHSRCTSLASSERSDTPDAICPLAPACARS
jgi:hypothetical protein